ncbi:Bug family tripartite tricarboxylate transporter substrate binding protein [Pollutimonas sp. M17]|uniref:Bug family tripartite tricarboxylate transporter substrate binding protein n=1 Tax=Pollutimonas sp. M17 TaxID=2962065 RepID=UPI0021F47606|nr:tripartite tricarboxylate transporter substrate binding protein [Pollutimonas sp. M17]UYO93937.1 tripartite tricarboxylate transporter substrate binding protein [Pollutimonas sp. M17]
MKRRTFLTAMAGMAVAPLVKAQALPAGPVKLIVGFSPGGGTDTMARVIAQHLGALWGIPVVVENKAGASGVIAATYVAQQPNDGTTLLMTNFSNHAIAPVLMPKIGYDVKRDFSPIMLVGITPTVLIGNQDQKANTVAELVELCRKNPGQISFGSAGVGAAQHMALEMFKLRAKIDALHVPYRGSGAMATDLLGGQINYSFETMTSATPLVSSGKVKALAQTGAQRAKSFPDIPTMAEQGFPGFEAGTWYGIVGPGGMNPALVQRMNEDFNRVVAMPEVAEKLQGFGAEDGGGSVDKFSAFIDAELKKWAEVVKEANVQPV